MAAQDTWDKNKAKGKEDSPGIRGLLQPVRNAAPSADSSWAALPYFWDKFVPDFASEKDSHHSEKRRSEAVQRVAMSCTPLHAYLTRCIYHLL